MYAKNIRVPSSHLGKRVQVRNLMFRFADTPNPNLHLGSGLMIWLNRTSNIRFEFGFEPGSKGSEPDRVTVASLDCMGSYLPGSVIIFEVRFFFWARNLVSNVPSVFVSLSQAPSAKVSGSRTGARACSESSQFPSVVIVCSLLWLCLDHSGIVKATRRDEVRFGASPCSGPGTGHLRRRGLGQTHENRGDVWDEIPHSIKIALQM